MNLLWNLARFIESVASEKLWDLLSQAWQGSQLVLVWNWERRAPIMLTMWIIILIC